MGRPASCSLSVTCRTTRDAYQRWDRLMSQRTRGDKCWMLRGADRAAVSVLQICQERSSVTCAASCQAHGHLGLRAGSRASGRWVWSTG